MTIAQLKNILKEMKQVVPFDDANTDIYIQGSYDPYIEFAVRIETKINNMSICIIKKIDKKESKKCL